MTDRLQRASLLMHQSRWDLAETELRQTLTQDPNLAPAHALLALCLSHKEEYQDATREAQAAVHLAPDDWFAHYALAGVFYDRNRPKEARQAVKEAIRLNPYNAMPWGLLALVEYALYRWSEALAAAEQGLAVDAEDSRCANVRSMALVKLGRNREAAAGLEDALSRDPEDALSQANKGWTLLERGDYRGAQICFREALRLEPGLDWARMGMVTALKARNPVYRLLLNYFLWMSRFSPRVQWALVIGLFIGYRVLCSVAERTPLLQPLVWPIIITYLAFVLLSWLADPLFNLLLRLDRFGRYVLSRDQTKGANLVGACALGVILSLVVGLVVGSPAVLMIALGCALLTVPCSAIFRCDRGWPRGAMGLYTGGLVLCGALGLVGAMLEIDNLGIFVGLFFLGVFLSSWVANGLMSATVRS
jgi:tetratricopeptide (TPR) repeat protein